jgi:hypothetical protein
MRYMTLELGGHSAVLVHNILLLHFGYVLMTLKGSISFLLPSPPINLQLHCLRHSQSTFSWLPPPSPPPHYLAVLVSQGAIIGRQTIASSLQFESVLVKWLMPITAQWVASCVASVYFSSLCVGSSSSGGGGGSYDSSSVSTGCPDVSRANLAVTESAEPLEGNGRLPRNEVEPACFSQWTCVCVSVDVEMVDSIGVLNNGTHGAMAVGGGGQGLKRAEVKWQ